MKVIIWGLFVFWYFKWDASSNTRFVFNIELDTIFIFTRFQLDSLPHRAISINARNSLSNIYFLAVIAF